jgi:hypothetical protein
MVVEKSVSDSDFFKVQGRSLVWWIGIRHTKQELRKTWRFNTFSTDPGSAGGKRIRLIPGLVRFHKLSDLIS